MTRGPFACLAFATADCVAAPSITVLLVCVQAGAIQDGCQMLLMVLPISILVQFLPCMQHCVNASCVIV